MASAKAAIAHNGIDLLQAKCDWDVMKCLRIADGAGEGEVGSRSRELSVAASIHAWFSASKDMLLAIS